MASQTGVSGSAAGGVAVSFGSVGSNISDTAYQQALATKDPLAVFEMTKTANKMRLVYDDTSPSGITPGYETNWSAITGWYPSTAFQISNGAAYSNGSGGNTAGTVLNSQSCAPYQNMRLQCLLTLPITVNTQKLIIGVSTDLANVSFTGTISNGSGSAGTQLVITAPLGTIQLGQQIGGSGVTVGTTITGFVSGILGGAGTYTVSTSQLVSTSVTMTTLPAPNYTNAYAIGFSESGQPYSVIAGVTANLPVDNGGSNQGTQNALFTAGTYLLTINIDEYTISFVATGIGSTTNEIRCQMPRPRGVNLVPYMYNIDTNQLTGMSIGPLSVRLGDATRAGFGLSTKGRTAIWTTIPVSLPQQAYITSTILKNLTSISSSIWYPAGTMLSIEPQNNSNGNNEVVTVSYSTASVPTSNSVGMAPFSLALQTATASTHLIGSVVSPYLLAAAASASATSISVFVYNQNNSSYLYPIGTILNLDYGNPLSEKVVTTSTLSPTCSFTATINNGSSGAGNILTVSTVTIGTLGIGTVINLNGIKPGTVITALGTGSGGTGTYTVSNSQLIASTVMTNNVYTVNVSALQNAHAQYALAIPNLTANVKIEFPLNYDSRNQHPMVMHFHADSSNENGMTDNGHDYQMYTAFINAGYIFLTATLNSNNGMTYNTYPSSFGTQYSLDAYTAAWRYARDKVNIGPVVISARSMGVGESLMALSERIIPNVVAWMGLSPSYNQLSNYTQVNPGLITANISAGATSFSSTVQIPSGAKIILDNTGTSNGSNRQEIVYSTGPQTGTGPWITPITACLNGHNANAAVNYNASGGTNNQYDNQYNCLLSTVNLTTTFPVGTTTLSLPVLYNAGTIIRLDSNCGIYGIAENVTVVGTPTGSGPYITTITATTQVHGQGFYPSNNTLPYSGTGNGYVSNPYLTIGAATGTYTLVATSATAFNIVLNGSTIGTVMVGIYYSSSVLNFIIIAGSTAFVAGDTFTLQSQCSVSNIPTQLIGNNALPNAFGPVGIPVHDASQLLNLNIGAFRGLPMFIGYAQDDVTLNQNDHGAALVTAATPYAVEMIVYPNIFGGHGNTPTNHQLQAMVKFADRYTGR